MKNKKEQPLKSKQGIRSKQVSSGKSISKSQRSSQTIEDDDELTNGETTRDYKTPTGEQNRMDNSLGVEQDKSKSFSAKQSSKSGSQNSGLVN